MMLGKRPRHPMKRTTSMTEITFDLGGGGEAPPSDTHTLLSNNKPHQIINPGLLDGFDQRFLSSTVSRRNNRRSSADFNSDSSPSFLITCSFCHRLLVPGRDIYMYRGDSGFCSSECRQKQMKQDERNEKCSLASKKEAAVSTSATPPPVSANQGETVAAS